MKVNKIYLDYASTTPVDKRVVKAMLPYFTNKFDNPSSIYSSAILTQEVVDLSRAKIASFLNCEPSEIIFTSGGTESDNLAIFGVAENYIKGHIVSTMIEHPAVFEAIKKLEKKGFTATYLKPGKDGIISADQVKKSLKKDTFLVSVMYANNEIGTIQPIREISKVIQEERENRKSKIKNKKLKKIGSIFLHTDACQATMYLPMDVSKLGVDLLSLNGSKIYAPKGIGVLYKKSEIALVPQIVGGEQESGMRAGTQNVPSIVGLAKAIELISQKQSDKELELRNYLITELKKIEGISINGSISKRLPNNVNFSISAVEGESVLLDLDRQGIEISTGSACSSRDLLPSRVISAIADEVTAHQSIRVSLGRFTKKNEIDIFLEALKKTVKRLKEMSPYGRS